MKTFTDSAGKAWEIAVNVTAIKRVKGLLGVDLLEVIDGQLLKRLALDVMLLCDVIYAICKPQADRDGISDEQFGERLAGEAIDGAAEAFLEELTAFFRNDQRAVLVKILEKQKQLQTAVRQRQIEMLDRQLLTDYVEKLAGKAERELESELLRLGALSGESPEDSDSIPAN